MTARKPRIGDQVYFYADGSRIDGTYIARWKENPGTYYARVMHSIRTADGRTIDTALPVYFA